MQSQTNIPSQLLKKPINILLKDAQDIDKDIKIISANDIGDLIINEQFVQILLAHLNYDAIDVQGNAIRIIGKIIKTITKEMVGKIINQLMSYLVKNQNDQIRDVYATCIKTIIQEVDYDFAQYICDNIINIGIDGIIIKDQSAIKKISMFWKRLLKL